MTSFRNDFVSSEINKFFNLNGRVTVNATILLLENSQTSSVTVKRDIQRKIIEVIQVLLLIATRIQTHFSATFFFF